MRPMTAQELIPILSTSAQNPEYKAKIHSLLKEASELIGEYSEIKPQYDAEVKRLQMGS